MITVILVEPEHPGNIGAVVRAMKNFNFNKLVMINPKCDPFCPEARNRAKHANNILDRSKVVKNLKVLDKYDYRVGTSSKLGNDFNLPRTPLTVKQLSTKISKLTSKTNIALVFGRESSGLTNEELKQMDFLVNIPTSKYSALNLSHAVTVVLYEIYQTKNPNQNEKKFTPVSRTEIKVMENMISKILDKQKFSTPDKKKTQKILWKHIITKSMLSKRESFALMGFFRKFLK
jgi:tRNA/rRNA methyltransferase